MKGVISSLETNIVDLNKEIRSKTEELTSVNKRLYDIENQFYKLKEKEDSLNALEKELEKIRVQNEDMISIRLKKMQAEYQTKFDDKIIEIKGSLQEAYNVKMASFMDGITEKMEQRIHSEKRNLVDDVFKFDGSSRDDIFELKRTKENLDKERETMEKAKFKLELDDLVSKSKEHVLDAKTSALDVKSENVEIRSDIKLMAGEFKNELLIEKTSREKSVDAVLHKLELEEERRKSDTKDTGNKIAMLAEQTKGQLIELASVVSNNLKDLEMKTMASFREVRENMSDMKLQFGQEVLRLDGQQGQILNELEKYYIKNQEFVNKCQSLALEARSQNIEGHSLLNQVNHMYSQHKVETKAMENQLQNTLDQVAVKEGHLANSIGESMLKLKSVSNEQYIAMKDMALEKKDINLLWKEKNQEHEMNLQEVRHQKQDLDRMKQFVDQEKSHFSDHKSSVLDNARLTHQLYMNEQRYVEAIKRAESSNGFLTRIAKGIEHSFSGS